jgi:transcriptional regulator with XRE-family HTH domain
MARRTYAAPTGGTSSEGRVSGYALKAVRESTGQTQEQFAEDLEVSAATVQGWESGRRPLMAMSAGNLLALRTRLRHLGVSPALLAALMQGLEADLFIGQALATPHHLADPAGHFLSTWVITRPFTEMTAWPLGGKAPPALERATRRDLRRGPVPTGPALGADERRHLIAHMQAVAERADRRTTGGLLLARQAYYLAGFDASPDTAAWLAEMYRADRRVVRPGKGWSQKWPLARSTASALTRLGDPEPMRRFIADQLSDETGERANLNYWAFWTGDFDKQQACDAFIGSTPLSAWHGDRLMRHLLDRLHGNIGFLELNIHTLWSLVRTRPEMISDAQVADELQAKIALLLDENLMSAGTRRELDSLRYGIAMARRY